MIRRCREVDTEPEVMTRPELHPSGLPWSWRCRIGNCQTVTQGGRPGLHAHIAVVHGLIPAEQDRR